MPYAHRHAVDASAIRTGAYPSFVVERDDLGSWLGGPAAGVRAERLGLPESGPGSLAGVGRRIVALCIDWAVSLGITALILPGDPFVTLGVFLVMNIILVGSIGFTIGHRLLGLQVRVLQERGNAGSFVGFWRSSVRSVLVCLVIPAVVWDSDGRGLHDRAAGTVITRR
jgi:uncharacterized RDD family membrane protein YckC